ncbi:MAG: aquaporin family protein [Planctomycetes bacterium]|nr:aquaporin family protein [Planctomycetota bacterium]
MAAPVPSLIARSGAELLGTFILVFFGCGSVHVDVLTGDLGLAAVALVWAIAIMLAIFCVGAVSGAHINPAMTLAFAAWGQFAWRDVPAYLAGQLAGAFLAAAVLFAFFQPMLTKKEQAKQVKRGEPGSEITACCYGEYFPNPGKLGSGPGPYDADAHAKHNELVSEPMACFAEFLGTLILALMVFALVDGGNAAAPAARLAPVFIGLTVAVLIMVIAPLTQACFNPARDLGPRLFAWLAGWGDIAIPGPRGTGMVTVYVLAPIAGAIAGGGVYCQGVRLFLPAPESESSPT